VARPDFGDATRNRAVALHQLGRTAKEIDQLESLVALQPDGLQPLLALANAPMGSGDSEGVLAALTRALAPNRPMIRYLPAHRSPIFGP
jgi:hypothetical protein